MDKPSQVLALIQRMATAETVEARRALARQARALIAAYEPTDDPRAVDQLARATALMERIKARRR